MAVAGSFKHSPGCACCTPIETCVVVTGCCREPIEGATVTIYRGETEIDTGTTDADGEWCTTEAVSGDTVTIEPPGGLPYAVIEDGSLNVGFSNSFVMVPSEGYHCACGVKPAPDDLTLNDEIGDIPVTWYDSTPVGGGWVGCAMRPALAACVSDRDCSSPASSPYPVDVAVGFIAQVGCGGSLVVHLFFPAVRIYRFFPGGYVYMLDGDATCADFLAGLASGFVTEHNNGIACSWIVWKKSLVQGVDASPSCDPLALQVDQLMRADCGEVSPSALNNSYGIYGGTTTFSIFE